MKEITINTELAKSRVLIGESFKNLSKYLPNKKTIIITDDNVIKHYGKDLPDFPTVVMGLGEKNKTMATLEMIFSKFLEYEVDRSWFVLAVGGGIVCDVSGFAASIYMRGLPFGFISTTLLSQVDASVGGKNGVNFEGYKNMIGVFNQPHFVICDMQMLKTLDKKEYLAGFAEIVKSGAIKSEKLFKYIENNAKGAVEMNMDVVEKMVYDSVQIKADVVTEDEREKGERRKLNLGHTFAHSFEKNLGILHGEAVSIGMMLAAKLSVQMGLLDHESEKRLENILISLGLPVKLGIKKEDLLSGMKKDKKREGDSIHLILLDKIGNAIIKSVTIKKLEELIDDMHSNF